MRAIYPDVDDGSEHPMTAAGTVLLAAGIFGIIDEDELARFTGYPRPFVVAILFNLRGSRLLRDGSYDCSEWLSSGGAIDGEAFWNHVEGACGLFLLPDVDFPALDPCQIYWNNKELS